jgi:hypothetical protein
MSRSSACSLLDFSTLPVWHLKQFLTLLTAQVAADRALEHDVLAVGGGKGAFTAKLILNFTIMLTFFTVVDYHWHVGQAKTQSFK